MITATTQSVNVNRKELIGFIKANRQEHIDEYNQAYSDYQAKVVNELKKALERARNGDFSKVSVNVTPPETHEADYDDVIEMLEMSVDENINLDRDSFKSYVKNIWRWTQMFKTLNASYKS